MEAEAKASEIASALVDAGLDFNKMDDFIKSEADVAKYLNILEAAKKERMKPIPADSPRGREITEQLFGKRGEVVDMKGNVIPEGSGIMAGESIESLMKSGDVTKGTVKKKSKKVTDRDMFRTANERLGKPKTDVNTIIKNINRLDPIEAMKEANKIIKRDGYYKNLSDKDAKKILEETEDHIFGRDIDPEPEDFAIGGRVGLKDGPPDPSKRKFMKIAAGVASIPIVGKFFKPAKVAKTVSKVPLVKTPPVAGKPEWFDALVNKVILEGDDVTKNFATKDREIVHVKQLGEGEGARVTRDLDEGTIRVEYESPTNLGEEPVIMEYKPGVADETTGGKKPADEFKVVETEPQYVGGPEDADIEFIGENVVNNVDEIVSDTSSLKQFATGKLDPRDLAVRKEKVKKTQAINNDPMEQAEFIENKYGGPIDYNDPMDFASGGLAYLLGE